MENIEKKIKTSRPVSLLLTVPALLFGLISMALAVVGLGLIPLIPAVIGILLTAASYFFFKKSYRFFTIFVASISIVAALVSVFRGTIIEEKVAEDKTFDSSVIKAQENIDSDLNEAFGDEVFESGENQDSVIIPKNVISGEQVYLDKCAVCHMQNGLGVGGAYPPLAGSDYLKNTPQVIDLVLFGVKGKMTVNGKPYNLQMPSPELTDEEATQVLNYIFTTWGNSEKLVTLTQIQTARDLKTKKVK